MKRQSSVVMLVLVLLLPANVFALDKWDKGDTIREAIYLSAWTVDWLQTRYTATHLNSYRELNPILGSQPSIGRVNSYFIAGAAAHVGISYILPKKLRKPWQYITIGYQAGAVAKNFNIGVGLHF